MTVTSKFSEQKLGWEFWCQ